MLKISVKYWNRYIYINNPKFYLFEKGSDFGETKIADSSQATITEWSGTWKSRN